MRRTIGLWVCCSLLLTSHAWAAAIGEAVENVSFKDIRFLPRTLSELGPAKAYVLLAVTNSAEESARGIAALGRIHERFGKEVVCVAVNVDPDDSIREMAAQAVETGAKFPFVKDVDGGCARVLGFSKVGEVAILDKDRVLKYRGGTADLEIPVAAIQEGSKAPDAVAADGPPIPPRKDPGPARAVTFAEHVAPIVKKHCQECHRPGTEAPFSLLTYSDVASVADMVAEVVAEERMPPWYASDKYGRFANHRGLSREERRVVADWVRAGKPEGDLSQAPAPIEAAPTRWQIGEPDLVVATAKTYTLPKTGYVPYQYAILPYLFLADTWVQAVEILPDNPRVVHHCNMAYTTVGKNWGDAKFITGRVPGVQPMNLEKGVAFFIPKGSVLILQIHFTTTGKDEKCRIEVGFRYPREVIKKQFHMLWMVDNDFAIPPGAGAHQVVGRNTLPVDAIGYGLFSHMHLRGRDMSFVAHYPDGRNETLLLIPNFSFDWQMGYRFEGNGRRFPKGTRLEAVAHYDNSTFNPYNPDPKATVKEGQQTYQEMLNGVFFYIDEHEELSLHVDPKTGRVVEPKSARG